MNKDIHKRKYTNEIRLNSLSKTLLILNEMFDFSSKIFGQIVNKNWSFISYELFYQKTFNN